MRILYFGDPQGAIQLLKAGMELVGLVHGRRGGPGWLGLFDILRERSRDTPRWMRPNLEDLGVQTELRATRPELIVSCFYPELIPSAILEYAPGLNVHPSDLPQWRGPDPIVHTLLSGQPTSAVCVHQLTEALDAGDVYVRHPVDIEPRAEAGTLSLNLEALGARLIAEAVVTWSRSGPITGRAQTGAISWAPQRSDAWWEIDWHRSASEIDRFVRAAHPHPGAYTGIGEELLVIQKAEPTNVGPFASLPVGTPFINEGVVAIRCGEGALALKRVKLGRRQLNGMQFARLLQ